MNIVAENHAVDKTYRSIQVTNVWRGQGDCIATLDLKVGGIFIRGVSLRPRRNDVIYLNFPNFKNQHGRWVHAIEITSPQLEAAVREEIYRAVTEAVR